MSRPSVDGGRALLTDRLVLRRFTASDAPAFAAMLADPETMRFLGDGGPLDEVRAWQSLTLIAGTWELAGYGQYALVDRSSGALVGRAGLTAPRPGLEGEIGWLIDRGRWGEGLAAEAAVAVVDDVFSRVGLTRVIALVDPENVASIRVAEKIGLLPRGIDDDAYARPHLVFGVERQEWEARRPTRVATGAAIEIRDFAEPDFDALFAIYAGAVERGELPRRAPATREMFAGGWLGGAHAVRIATRGGRLVGGAFVRQAFRDDAAPDIGNGGYLVSPAARGGGVGSALLEDSLAVAAALGFRALLFMRIAAGSPGEAAYRARGFREIGRVPGGLGERDAVLMWREVDATPPS